MITVTINGDSVSYKQGIVITEKLTEDLDTGFLIVPQTTELTVEPMDVVTIIDSSISFTKSMMISDIAKKISKWDSTREYNYELGLISPTIQLQRIVLPNRSITQPVEDAKTSIYTVLLRFVAMYSDFTISQALEDLTTNVDCPEFQWNRPTLFEVCNDLLSEVDAVITFTAGSTTSLNYLDLNTDGSAITGSFTDIVETQNITDYADKIECEIENAVVGKRNTRTVEWIAVKTDVDAIITTENFKLILEKPIYKINKITQGYYDSGWFTADVTDYVVEKKVYDILPPNNSGSLVTGAYKRNRYYYEEGSNIIDGMNYHEKTWTGVSSLKAIINVFNNASGQSLINDDCLDLVFKVDYQAQETVKLISNKQTTLSHNSTLINNQDTSYVDFGAFARKQQTTVNRLGNQTLTLTRKYQGDITDIPSLGDMYDTDYKLAEREFAIFDNYVNFKGICSKNYVMKDIFTGIKSERRYTRIASGSEAFESNHIEEINLNLSNTDATSSATIENYFLRFGLANDGIEVVKFQTDESDELLVAPSAYWTNKSFILTWKMYDNYNAGISSTSTIEFSGTTIGVANAPYVDSNGKYVYYDYSLYKSMDYDSETLTIKRRLPLYLTLTVDLNDLVFSDTSIYRYKDNREITVETKQFNITSDIDVFAGNLYFENHSLTYVETTDIEMYVAYSTTLTYSKGDQTKKGTIAARADLNFSRTNNYIRISSSSGNVTIADLASWCICDSSGNIYLANNGNDEYIYLNKEA